MQIIKGFVTLDKYIDNVPGSISKLGELSDYAYTYSKNKGEYNDTAYPDYKLISFSCLDNVTNTEVTVKPIEVTEILSIVKTCVDFQVGKIKPIVSIDLYNTLIAAFGTRITGLQLGPIVDGANVSLPSFLSWTSVAIDPKDNNIIKIWLANDAFADQYDQFEISVIPPLTNVDDLFGSFTAASNLIKARTLPQLGDLINVASGSSPESFIKFNVFDMINPLNATQKTPCNWTTLIWGRAGDNIDSIKDAIIDYILKHSTHTREEWATRFPDLFKRTEFIILPRWDKVAIPNLSNLSALYSSIMDPTECKKFATDNIKLYPTAHIESNINIIPHDYKALMLVVINGKDNVDGKKKITDLFNDYIPVSTASLEFNRMSVLTRDWLVIVEKLLIGAEMAGATTVIDKTLRKTYRDGILYVSAVYDNVNYLVAAKSNPMYTTV